MEGGKVRVFIYLILEYTANKENGDRVSNSMI